MLLLGSLGHAPSLKIYSPEIESGTNNNKSSYIIIILMEIQEAVKLMVGG